MKAPQIILQLDPGLASNLPISLSSNQVEQLLIKGIQSDLLAKTGTAILELGEEIISSEARETVNRALHACKSISESTSSERLRILELFSKHGIDAVDSAERTDDALLQAPSISINVPACKLSGATTLARTIGYIDWVPWKNGEMECYIHTGKPIVMVNTDDSTTRLELQCSSKPNSRLFSMLSPTELDFDFVDLPRSLWMLYFIVKPLRVMRGRLSGQPPYRAPWPYLGTPIHLASELFKMANLTSEDTLVDLGCGDGRIVAEAAERYGCRALGIELNESLACLARQKINEKCLEQLVTIKCGDANTVPLPVEPCVVFLFIPVENVPGMIDTLHEKLAPGSRIITHEQNEFHTKIPPEASRALFTTSAVTVAHVWTV